MSKMLKDIVKEHERDLTKERDERCVPVAKEVLNMIAAVDGLAGNVKPELLEKCYDQVAKDILQLYLDKNILVSEANFVQQLVLQIINESLGIVSISINNNLKNIEKMMFGGKDVRDVGMQELDAKLKEFVK